MNPIPSPEVLDVLPRNILEAIVHEKDREIPVEQSQLAYIKRLLRSLDRADAKRAAREATCA